MVKLSFQYNKKRLLTHVCSNWGFWFNQKPFLYLQSPAPARIPSRGNGIQKQGSRKLLRVGKIIRPREGIRAGAGGALAVIFWEFVLQLTFYKKFAKNLRKNIKHCKFATSIPRTPLTQAQFAGLFYFIY